MNAVALTSYWLVAASIVIIAVVLVFSACSFVAFAGLLIDRIGVKGKRRIATVINCNMTTDCG